MMLGGACLGQQPDYPRPAPQCLPAGVGGSRASLKFEGEQRERR